MSKFKFEPPFVFVPKYGRVVGRYLPEESLEPGLPQYKITEEITITRTHPFTALPLSWGDFRRDAKRFFPKLSKFAERCLLNTGMDLRTVLDFEDACFENVTCWPRFRESEKRVFYEMALMANPEARSMYVQQLCPNAPQEVRKVLDELVPVGNIDISSNDLEWMKEYLWLSPELGSMIGKLRVNDLRAHEYVYPYQSLPENEFREKFKNQIDMIEAQRQNESRERLNHLVCRFNERDYRTIYSERRTIQKEVIKTIREGKEEVLAEKLKQNSLSSVTPFLNIVEGYWKVFETAGLILHE